jgi:hypothetical protein
MQLQVNEYEAENGEVRQMKTSGQVLQMLREKEPKEFKSRFLTILEALSFEIQWQAKQERK